MNKKILALVLTAAISFSSAITAFAADTSTNISLNDKSKFSVTLQSNSLVFNNEPTDREYDSVTLDICTVTGTVVGKTTYDRGQGNGATISLSGIPDGSYLVRVGYVNNGFKQYRDRYAYTLEVKNGVGSFKTLSFYAANLKSSANERTDAEALSYYKINSSEADIKQANIITAGITNEYDKAKAIHDWVSSNMYYDYSDQTTIFEDKEAGNAELYPGGPLKRGKCETISGATTKLMAAAGLPAKQATGNANVNGELIAHAWTEVFVDGRWVFCDSTFDCQNMFDGKFSSKTEGSDTYFDMSISEWSITHEVGNSLITGDKNIANNTAERTGFDAKTAATAGFTVKFDSQGGSAVDSVNVARGAGGSGKVTEPATPTKAGYTFVGWVVSNPHNSALWKFDTNVVSYNVTMYAKWQAN